MAQPFDEGTEVGYEQLRSEAQARAAQINENWAVRQANRAAFNAAKPQPCLLGPYELGGAIWQVHMQALHVHLSDLTTAQLRRIARDGIAALDGQQPPPPGLSYHFGPECADEDLKQAARDILRDDLEAREEALREDGETPEQANARIRAQESLAPWDECPS